MTDSAQSIIESDNVPELLDMDTWTLLAKQSPDYLIYKINQLSPEQIRELHTLALQTRPFVFCLLRGRPYRFDDLEYIMKALECPEIDIYKLTNGSGTPLAGALIVDNDTELTPGRKALFEKLIADTDVNRQDEGTGLTLAHHATYEGRLDILEILLNHGANTSIIGINEKDCRGMAEIRESFEINPGYVRRFDATVLAHQLKGSVTATKQKARL